MKAIFTRANGETFARESEYDVITSARLQLISSQLDLGAGQSTTVRLTLTKADGTPAAGAHVDLAATLGVLSTPQVTTDGQGRAELTFTAGSSNGQAEISALYSPPSSPGQAPEQISRLLKLNVTGLVGLNFNVRQGGVAAAGLAEGESVDEPPVVLPGGFANLFADLLVGDDRVASVPVQFSLQGSGALRTLNSQTDEFGLAETIYVPPATGSGTSTITATATVDGQTYTRSVDIRFEPATQSLLGDWLDPTSHGLFGLLRPEDGTGATSVMIRHSIIDGTLVNTHYDVTIDWELDAYNLPRPAANYRGPVTGNSFSGQSIATFQCMSSDWCFITPPYDGGPPSFSKSTLTLTLTGDTLTVVVTNVRAGVTTATDTSIARRVDAVPKWPLPNE